MTDSFNFAGAFTQYNPDKEGILKHLFLDLEFDLSSFSFFGKAKLLIQTFSKNTNTFSLNAVGMNIEEVKIDGEVVNYNYDGKTLVVNFDQESEKLQNLLLEIQYRVENPTKGIYFIHPDKDYPNQPWQVWSQGESEESRYWYPCFDYPTQIASTEVKMTIPKNFTGISNGKKISEEIVGTKKTVHWLQEKPHSTYLVMVAIGEFVCVEDKWKNLPVLYYTDKQKSQLLNIDPVKTPKMIDFFSSFFEVKYPWDKYTQIWASKFIWGGMENTSATINTDSALVDERAKKDFNFGETLIAHELSHQWFGNYIAVNHWGELWIKEGAATYSEQLWYEYEYGKDEADYYRWQEIGEYLCEAKSDYMRPTSLHLYRDTDDLYDRHSYTKAGLIYHMLRVNLNDDELFTKFYKTFLTDNKHKNVGSLDLIKAYEKSTGRNIKPIIDQYILRAGHPILKVKYSWDNSVRILKLTIKQNQYNSQNSSQTIFNLKNLPVQFFYLNNEKREAELISSHINTIHLSQSEETFYFYLHKQPDWVTVDGRGDYLAEMELDASQTNLTNQLKYDPNVISRIRAAETISKNSTLNSVKTLYESYKSECFWGVRKAIINALSDIRIEQVSDILSESLEDENSQVRIATIQALKNFPTKKNFELLYKFYNQGDDSYFTLATCLTVLGTLAHHLQGDYIKKAFELQKQAVFSKQPSWNWTIESGAVLGVSKLKDHQEAFELLISLSKRGTETKIRLTALTGLSSFAIVSNIDKVDKIIQILENASFENDLPVQMAVVNACARLENYRSIGVLQSLLDRTIYPRIKRKVEKTIEKLQKQIGLDKSLDKINLKLQELENENRELKSRLLELEHKSDSHGDK
jgi:aminopeptidase N